MGAEQSSVLEGEPLPTLYQGLDATAFCSLPASPVHSSHSDSSQKSLQQPGRSHSLLIDKTLSNFDRNGPSAAHRATSNCMLATESNTLYRCSSLSDATSRGIVVVCPGPLKHSARSTSYDSLSNRAQSEARAFNRRLDHIPTFRPFLSKRQNKPQLESSSHANYKLFQPNLATIDSSKLVNVVDVYRSYVREAVESTCKSQQRILGIQNKVDYELRRISEDMNSRVMGTPPSSGRSLSGDHLTVNLAGQKQIDEIVLQSTQISGLIGQSVQMIKQLKESLELLNRRLPETLQLPPLSLPYDNLD